MELSESMDGDGLIIRDVNLGLCIESKDGHKMRVMEQNGTFTIEVTPSGWTRSGWFRVNMKTSEIEPDDMRIEEKHVNQVGYRFS